MKKFDRSGLRTWIEVDREAIKKNYQTFRSRLSPKTNPPTKEDIRVKLMAVVKSNAYGHGLHDFALEMEKLGADWLGVDSAVEALTLREIGIKKPILVLGYTLPEMIAAAAASDISITVSTFESLKYILKNQEKFSKPLKIHIKVDTGMHRQGFLLPQQKTLTAKIKNQNAKVIVEGLCTHFAAAKNALLHEDTKGQIAEFKKWIQAFEGAGLKPLVHASATAGTLLYPEAHFDMVRVGIGLYGLWPAKEIETHLHDKVSLNPVLTWKTIVGEVKKVSKGARVGYDFTETLSRNSTIAVCPVGYWHGYPRALSSVGQVLVGNKKTKVIGRVSMDMIVIDVTDILGVKVGDEVMLLGRSGKQEISAEDMADLAKTSSYEIITRLNPLIKRFYI